MTQSSLARATGSFPPTLGKEQPFLRHFNRTKCHYNVGIDNESIRNQNPKSLLSSCKVIAQQSGLLERCLGMWLWFKTERSFKKRGAWYYCHTCEYLLRLATGTAPFAIVVSNHMTQILYLFCRIQLGLKFLWHPCSCQCFVAHLRRRTTSFEPSPPTA